MNHSDDKPINRPGSSLAVWLIAAAVLTPVAYVLSSGPLLLAWKHHHVGDWVYWFFAPLKYCHQNIPAAKAFFDWYLELWGAA